VLRLLRRWLIRTALVLAVGLIAAYAGDWATFLLRGRPMSKVTVNQYMSIPLKGNKTEYDYMGTMDVPCSRSLFPEGGQSPCWEVRRDANQTLKM